MKRRTLKGLRPGRQPELHYNVFIALLEAATRPCWSPVLRTCGLNKGVLHIPVSMSGRALLVRLRACRKETYARPINHTAFHGAEPVCWLRRGQRVGESQSLGTPA